MTETNVQKPREPFFNAPPVTTWLVFAVIVLHIIKPFAVERLLAYQFAFVPVDFWNAPLPNMYRTVTYAFVHANIMHLMINATGLLAFASGIERTLGRLWLLVILFAGTVCGVLGHLILFHDSDVPLVGISAGVSALFGALMLVMNGRRGALTTGLVFVATNAAIGLIGMPNEPGLAIAWQAHIFGFFTGMILGAIATRERA